MRSGRISEVKAAIAVSAVGLAILAWPAEPESSVVASLSGRGSIAEMIQGPLMAEGAVRPLSAEASRVALTALSMNDDIASRNAFSAMSAGDAASVEIGGGVLTVAVLNPESEGGAYAALNADVRREGAVVIDPREPDATLSVDYAMELTSPGRPGELDVEVRPRAVVALGPDGSAAGAGAEVRFGEFVNQSADASRWYVYAAADRRALLYDPMQGANLSNAFAYTPREIVGDAQAGVAVRFGEVDLSLAYVRREYRHTAGVHDFDESEDFGAVSVNWRW